LTEQKKKSPHPANKTAVAQPSESKPTPKPAIAEISDLNASKSANVEIDSTAGLDLSAL
jgi:hypothetical protein